MNKIYIWANLSRDPKREEIKIMNDGRLILLRSETFDSCFQYKNYIQLIDSIQSQVRFMTHNGFDVTLVSPSFYPVAQVYLGMSWSICPISFITPSLEWEEL